MTCFFHKWSKWEQYEIKMYYAEFSDKPFDQPIQKRHCEKCGYEQREEVNA